MKSFFSLLLALIIAVPCFAAPEDKMTDYLQRAKTDGILFGDEKGNLEEDKIAVRAEFLAILVRFLGLSGGENSFSDVSDSDWFADSMAAAKLSGIFSGYDDGTARPYEPITTEDAVAIVGRYYNVSEHKGTYSGVVGYAADYFGYAFENGIFSAWQQLPNPKAGITKGEIVSILYRYREENSENSCFYQGYPKISDTQSFNTISFDVKLAEDCAVYYALCEKGKRDYKWVKADDSLQKGAEKTVHAAADISKTYDLYVKAVSKNSGVTRIKGIENVVPLAFLRGNGTQINPYIIFTQTQLMQISSFPDRSYILGGNIKLSKSWEPIKNFSGTLNGDGYKITDLSVKKSDKNAGLFAQISGGTVRNLTVDASVNAKSAAGIIAGENRGKIEDCCVTGTVEAANNNGGGICGLNKGEIKNCLACAYSVRAGSFAGGIAGGNEGNITNCLSAVETVTSDMYAGGIAGQNNGGSIENCVAANIAVYNTMTNNGGKISTNRNNGEMRNNFSFSGMVSNAALTEESADSRNGMEIPWDKLKDREFYAEIGWSSKNWKKADGGFELICPKGAAEPILKSGQTPYFLQKIYSSDDLVAIAKNGRGHYILANDITLRIPWKTIDIKEGFTGTLDGGGHTIYNMTLKGGSGMFSNIAGGTVKNLRLFGVTANQGFDGGIITACNYGYIENCTVSGKIQPDTAKITGGIAGENNGLIADCSVNAEIVGKSVKAGGICAVNNAVIEKCAFSGSVDLEGTEIGGICGQAVDGYISESVANAMLLTSGDSVCTGGICAKSQNCQIYKCASLGSIKQLSKDTVSGGICAEAKETAIYDCFSTQDISAGSENAVSGGICGEALETNIQNTYASGKIMLSVENAVSGGICGRAVGSYIMQNVALNPEIYGKKSVGAILAEGEECDISGNYARSNMKVNSGTVTREEKNGTLKTFAELSKPDFYLTPLSEGGLLGWEDTAWQESGTEYPLPVLKDTPLMDTVK